MAMHDRAHLQALLTRAAIVEAAHQRASKAGDTDAKTAAVFELDQLREAYRAAEVAQAAQTA